MEEDERKPNSDNAGVSLDGTTVQDAFPSKKKERKKGLDPIFGIFTGPNKHGILLVLPLSRKSHHM